MDTIRMIVRQFFILLLLCVATLAPAQSNSLPIVQRRWIEIKTAHFDIFSCGAPQDVNKLAARLEQFCKAYSQLAGMQAVESPPTVVMAFPDHEAMTPFLPLYQGKPASLSGFFMHGSDENLIVLSLADSSGMNVIFHEYAHLLFRRNDQIWPLWLNEGMAEIYSTFTTTGAEIQIARPIPQHLYELKHQALMPLHELFSVNHDSPQYNESSRQGIFYAESWLLTHYLVAGDNPDYKARFGRFTQLLEQGELPEQAFTNALGAPLSVIETQLRNYLARGQFKPIGLTLGADISASVSATTRTIYPVEIYFHLGDELLRIDRVDAAENYFEQDKKLAPANPLPYEGLGLVAAQRDRHAEAASNMQEALKRGSMDFLAHYIYAREKFRMTADGDRYHRLDDAAAKEIRDELLTSLALMPHFAGAHELLGFFEMVQGNDSAAEPQLQQAIQLEPENPSYLLTLAQLQIRERNSIAARQTLQPLLLPNADAKLRVTAEELMQKINQH
jgi:tetratricopeptide (TPR) repeat protein